MILGESKSLLNRADKSLREIDRLYKTAIVEKTIKDDIKIEIMHFLVNCRSALDFAAFYIFSTICAKDFSADEIEKKEQQVDFPVKFSEKSFERCLNDYFTGVKEAIPDIIEVFEKCQPYKQVGWMKTFNKLLNSNKHRKFSRQERQVTNHVHYFEAPGLRMINCTFVNCETPISYNGIPVNFNSPQPHPLVNAFHATTTFDFLFTELNKPVIPTLQNIYSEVTAIIDELEMILQGQS